MNVLRTQAAFAASDLTHVREPENIVIEFNRAHGIVIRHRFQKRTQHPKRSRVSFGNGIRQYFVSPNRSLED